MRTTIITQILAFTALLCCHEVLMAQTDTTKKTGKTTEKPSWFDTHVTIGQSMTTAELTSQPAQFQITIPKNQGTSYLIDIGSSIRLDSKSNSLISKITVEYHRNTLTDQAQNNLEAGYTGTWRFASANKVSYFLIFDPKFVLDQVNANHSIASNLLFTWTNRKAHKLHWNTNTYLDEDKKNSIFISLFFGAQVQQILSGDQSNVTGFILRPLYTGTASYSLNHADPDHNPYLTWSTTYTGRDDAVNETSAKEGYTHLLKTGVDFYLMYKPLKLSVGASFNYGSDPLQGLKQQQYWLISLNIAK